jgi:hypothetical protein
MATKEKAQGTKHGVRSPMHGYEQQESHRMPSTAGTSEVIPGSAPKPAPISSPNKSPATVDTGRKSYDDQHRD